METITTSPDRQRTALFVGAAVTALAIATALIFGMSSADFTAQTQNPGNAWETGQVNLTDDALGVALFNARGIVPGYTETQDIVVTYTGPQTADLTFEADVGGALTQFLTLEVTRNGDPVFSGLMVDFDDNYTMVPDTSDTWVFTAAMPSGTGNDAEGLVANASFVWTAVVAD